MDNAQASFGATEHLLGLGYEAVAFVHQNAALGAAPSSVRERLRGYREALEVYGRPFNPAWLVSMKAGPGYLEQLRGVRAAVAVNDLTALELLEDAARAGVRIPEDLAVVGFDDLPQASGFALTTVAQPGFEIGRRAAERLIDRLGGDSSPVRQILLPTRLVVRRSSGAANAR